MTCTVVEWLPVFTRPDAVQFLLDSWTHLRQHDGFQGNETTGRWSAMGCVPTLERGNDKIKLPAQTLIPGPSPGGGRGWSPLPSGEGRVKETGGKPNLFRGHTYISIAYVTVISQCFRYLWSRVA